MRWGVIALIAGCRLHFDPVRDDATTAPDARPRMTFGERTSSLHGNVTTDTTLDEAFRPSNCGGCGDFSVAGSTPDRNHTVIRFELQALPPGTRVRSAALELVVLDFGDQVEGLLAAAPLTEPWVEGASDRAPGPGATWVVRDAGNPWTTEGGTASAAVATFLPAAAVVVLDVPATLVESWIDDPPANHGLLLVPADSGAMTHYHFHARDSVDVEARPELAIELAP